MDVYASFWDIENDELGDTLNNFLTIYTPKKYEIESVKKYWGKWYIGKTDKRGKKDVEEMGNMKIYFKNDILENRHKTI